MTLKPRGRARLTNDPMRVRAKGNTAKGKRLRDLYAAFSAKLGPDDVVGQASALRCAELVATGEDLRAQLRAGGLKAAEQAALLAELVRVENLSDRSERRLRQIEHGEKRPYTVQDVWAALERDDEEEPK
jgi:hypothetical protein